MEIAEQSKAVICYITMPLRASKWTQCLHEELLCSPPSGTFHQDLTISTYATFFHTNNWSAKHHPWLLVFVVAKI